MMRFAFRECSQPKQFASIDFSFLPIFLQYKKWTFPLEWRLLRSWFNQPIEQVAELRSDLVTRVKRLDAAFLDFERCTVDLRNLVHDVS